MRDVKFFPAELGPSGWFETSSFKNHRFNDPTEILDNYDFVVVGGGYGGFGAAWRFAELNPGAKIALFEAIRIGQNDSGKNAGFLLLLGDDEENLAVERWARQCLNLPMVW